MYKTFRRNDSEEKRKFIKHKMNNFFNMHLILIRVIRIVIIFTLKRFAFPKWL